MQSQSYSKHRERMQGSKSQYSLGGQGSYVNRKLSEDQDRFRVVGNRADGLDAIKQRISRYIRDNNNKIIYKYKKSLARIQLRKQEKEAYDSHRSLAIHKQTLQQLTLAMRDNLQLSPMRPYRGPTHPPPDLYSSCLTDSQKSLPDRPHMDNPQTNHLAYKRVARQEMLQKTPNGRIHENGKIKIKLSLARQIKEARQNQKMQIIRDNLRKIVDKKQQQMKQKKRVNRKFAGIQKSIEQINTAPRESKEKVWVEQQPYKDWFTLSHH